MTRSEAQRMAEAIVRLRDEILRRRDEGPEWGSDLPAPHARAVRAIVRAAPVRMGELAEELGVTVATASRTVTALEELGFVAREPDPEDARAVLVVMTATGLREQRRRRERFTAALERLFSELSATERDELGRALDTLARIFTGEPLGDQEPRSGSKRSSVS